MTFVVSEGQLRALDRVHDHRPYTVRLASDFTADYAEIWRTQPQVRTVVSFLGRNIAALGLHTFERLSDTDRRRVTDHPLPRLLGRPNPWTTRYRMVDALVQDLAVYDVAYLLKMLVASDVAALARLEPARVKPKGTGGFMAEKFEYRGERGAKEFDRDQVVHFHGYNPTDPVNGSSPIEALRRILAEEWEAGRMREQTLRNGARFSGYLERPAGATWSDEARTKFSRDWQAQWSGNGPQAGGTPLLEDGMKFTPAGQNAEQLQYVQARQLTREEVAAAYHIPPPMVGVLDKATFSNISEQHKMLYQDTLGPWLTMICEELGLQLVPDFDDADALYVEFNLAEKLRGSFEDQATQLQASVGAPWLTRNEARARNNLPALDGGDELVVPLNVLVGGQASPVDSGSQNRRAGSARTKAAGTRLAGDGTAVRIKSGARTEDEKAAEQLLKRFFARQRAAVLSALGAKADDDWWDADRWDDELADDLEQLALTATSAIAADTLADLGVDPEVYQVARTRKFLRSVAESRAGAINATTRDQLLAALADDVGEEAERSTPAGVFDQAETSRAHSAALSLATTLAGFAVAEVGRQMNRPRTTKTWVVQSGNPRASHALMDGETVGIDDTFSNGMAWPGDPAGGVDEVAGCMCGVEVTIP